MANSGSDGAGVINRAAAAMGLVDPQYQVPEERSRKGYWSKFWCFGAQKRGKQIMPASQLDGATGVSQSWAAAGPVLAGLAVAPPSSPASIVNSSAQSPASFTLPLSLASESMFSPGPANMMFTIGPYAHETQLVSPPVFSTFTTEPSTASLTPHPELAHLTTPSSPDVHEVPFAQLLEAKSVALEHASRFSLLSFASPSDVAAGLPRASCLY